MALAGLLHWRVAISCIKVMVNLIILQNKSGIHIACWLVRQVLNIPLKTWVMPSVVKSSVMQWAAVKTVLDNCLKKEGNTVTQFLNLI